MHIYVLVDCVIACGGQYLHRCVLLLWYDCDHDIVSSYLLNQSYCDYPIYAWEFQPVRNLTGRHCALRQLTPDLCIVGLI